MWQVSDIDHESSGRFATDPGSTTSSAAPQWLTDALAELDALQRPVDVNPQVFADLKVRLAELLRDKAAGKMASAISQTYTTALDLHFEQDSVNSDVYLKWGYVNRGDYNQDSTVTISDLTPLARYYTESWFEGDWEPARAYIPEYYSAVSVTDGDIDGLVEVGDDLAVLAANFGNWVSKYVVLGSDNPDSPIANMTEVGVVQYLEHENIGPSPYQKRLPFKFNVTALDPEDKFAYYWVRPDDGQGNVGALSDSYWTGPNDTTPNPADLPAVVATVYPSEHVYGQEGTDVTFSYALSAGRPRPAVAQEWDFGGAAAGETQVFTEAAPTITLRDAIGRYDCTVKAENAFGWSEGFPFVVTVTTEQQIPVVSRVVQDGFTPSAEATFTCELTVGPGESYEWYFAGGATPNSTTTEDASVTVTLGAVGDYDASLTVTNTYGNDVYNFTLKVTAGLTPPTVTLTLDGNTGVAVAEDADGDFLTFDFAFLSGGEYVRVCPEHVDPTDEYTQHIDLTNMSPQEQAVTVEVTVSDGAGKGEDKDDDNTLVPPGFTPPSNAIWMAVDRTEVKVGETVTFLIWACDLTYTIRYLNSAMIQFDDIFYVDSDDGKFDPETMNPGMFGGDIEFPDGLWALLPNVDRIMWSEISLKMFGPHAANYYVDGELVPPGNLYMAVNVSPIFDGDPTSAPPGTTGELFNFVLTADEAGTATFKFIRKYSNSAGGPEIDGTLYSEDESTQHYFEDSQQVIITVTE